MKKIIITAAFLYLSVTSYENTYYTYRVYKTENVKIARKKYQKLNITQEVTELIQKYSTLYNVPYYVATRVAFIESGYRPSYEEYNPFVTSPAGACGVYQVLPSTASWLLGEDISDVELIYDLSLNVKVGIQYLSYLKGELGSWEYAIAAYNHGIGNVLNKSTGDFSADAELYPQETQNYLERVDFSRITPAY